MDVLHAALYGAFGGLIAELIRGYGSIARWRATRETLISRRDQVPSIFVYIDLRRL